jgi:hypothetical protein
LFGCEDESNEILRNIFLLNESVAKHSQIYTNILLHIPWNRVLLEKLTGLKLVKKFLEFYGTRRVITAFISARHLSLS